MSRPTLRKDHTESRTERGAGGQRVTHTEHWDGSVDVKVEPVAVQLQARAEVIDIRTEATVQAKSVGMRATTKGGAHDKGR